VTRVERIKVKICGLTTAADAAACRELGADYLGLIFADSPRRVTVERAGEIRKAVPDATMVGVFVDAEPDAVVETALACRLDMIQLHGGESFLYRAEIAERCRLPVLKAMRLRELAHGGGSGDLAGVDSLLLDLDKGVSGAEATASRPVLWAAAAELRRTGRKVFLAGALTPENVAAAVLRAGPHGVDVCSGVELEPGRKDLDAVARFIREARHARS